jgi:predicted Fe-Mo cluster-binding NifX family protein
VKVAVCTWDGRISPVFDVCKGALILSIHGGVVVARSRESLETPTPSSKLERLRALGVETLICGAVSEPLRRELTAGGIQVVGFVAGEVEEVVASFLAGTLPSPALSMPGCRGWRRRHRGRRGRERGGSW